MGDNMARKISKKEIENVFNDLQIHETTINHGAFQVWDVHPIEKGTRIIMKAYKWCGLMSDLLDVLTENEDFIECLRESLKEFSEKTGRNTII